MSVYHKIQTVYKRDPNNNLKTLLEGDYSLPEFEYLKDNIWLFTEKVDGTNIRIIPTLSNVEIRGKTDNAQIYPSLLKNIQSIFDNVHGDMIELFNLEEEKEINLYGEGYGAKIQSGGKYSSTQEFVLFDIKIGKWWLKRNDIEEIAAKLKIDIVPVIGSGSLSYMVDIAREGFTSTWGDFTAEGIVARPEVELYSRNGSRIITKIKHKDFK
jgi:hypothetical protein